MGTPLIDIEKLDTDQRLELIEELWESLRVNPDGVPISEEQKRELDRRLDRLESDEAPGIPWEAVRERIQGRLK
jgi:putative addiction module component (TIGR02574 family)